MGKMYPTTNCCWCCMSISSNENRWMDELHQIWWSCFAIWRIQCNLQQFGALLGWLWWEQSWITGTTPASWLLVFTPWRRIDRQVDLSRPGTHLTLKLSVYDYIFHLTMQEYFCTLYNLRFYLHYLHQTLSKSSIYPTMEELVWAILFRHPQNIPNGRSLQTSP